MALKLIPQDVAERFHIEERHHAAAILSADCPEEFKDMMDCLRQFRLLRSEIEVGGGRKSKIADRFDKFLARRGWKEKSTKVSRTIDDVTVVSETHRVDFFKKKVAVEVEWNNKDPFFSRDLNAFRLLHELNVISVGVIITRMDELQNIFNRLYDKNGESCGRKYGPSTTHWSKLIPRVDAGGAGMCPLLLVGITKSCYRDDVRQ